MEERGFPEVVALAARLMEGAGVAVMVAGVLVALGLLAVRHPPGQAPEDSAFRRFRVNLGRAILLGLEFLVAADIIRTVSEVPTLQGVVVLGIIVLIRTFLSFTLQLELEGRWPWQRRPELSGGRAGRAAAAARERAGAREEQPPAGH